MQSHFSRFCRLARTRDSGYENLTMNSLSRLLLLLVSLFAAGCATTAFQTDTLDSHIGTWTYSDAVKKYGQPDSSQTLSDGTLVAKWMREKSGVYQVQQFDPNNSSYSPADPMTFKSYLKMYFNKQKILQSWKFETEDPRIVVRERSSGGSDRP